jgi:hypothetical protein
VHRPAGVGIREPGRVDCLAANTVHLVPPHSVEARSPPSTASCQMGR